MLLQLFTQGHLLSSPLLSSPLFSSLLFSTPLLLSSLFFFSPLLSSLFLSSPLLSSPLLFSPLTQPLSALVCCQLLFGRVRHMHLRLQHPTPPRPHEPQGTRSALSHFIAV